MSNFYLAIAGGEINGELPCKRMLGLPVTTETAGPAAALPGQRRAPLAYTPARHRLPFGLGHQSDAADMKAARAGNGKKVFKTAFRSSYSKTWTLDRFYARSTGMF